MDATSSGVLWEAAPGQFLLRVPGVARYLVEQGTTITVERAPDAEPADVDRFLRGTPTAVVHLQRGTPVLHAAVVAQPEPGRGAIVLAGDSGAGKSALTATLWMRGYQVLADDLAPLVIDHTGVEQPAVLPTGHEVVLWPDTVEHLAKAHPDDRRLSDDRVLVHGPSGQRRCIAADDATDAGPCKVDAIWWVSVHGGDLAVSELRGAARFGALGSLAANSRIAGALLDPRAYLGIAGALAKSTVPIRRLKRQRGAWSTDAMADLVELHVAD